MTRIYLVRHAQAEGNVKNIFQAHYNSKLTETGEKQLSLLSERFRNTSFDVCFSSDMDRAYLTAKAALKYNPMQIHKTKMLREISGGLWENVPMDKLPILFPDEYSVWENEPWNCSLPGGETMQQISDRVWTFVSDIVDKYKDKQILLVSHGCAIRNILNRAMGKPLDNIANIDWCENTSVSIVDFDSEKEPKISLMCDISHLSSIMPAEAYHDWWKIKKASGLH